jgi:hypothetical protein
MFEHLAGASVMVAGDYLVPQCTRLQYVLFMTSEWRFQTLP